MKPFSKFIFFVGFGFLISSLFLPYTPLYAAKPPAVVIEANGDKEDTTGIKRKTSEGQPHEDDEQQAPGSYLEKPFLSFLPIDLECHIASFLPLPDLGRLERTCRSMLRDLSDALQYQALISSWEAEVHALQRCQVSYRARFMQLQREKSPAFEVHMADLWRHSFPLRFYNNNLPEKSYWTQYLKDADLMNGWIGKYIYNLYTDFINGNTPEFTYYMVSYHMKHLNNEPCSREHILGEYHRSLLTTRQKAALGRIILSREDPMRRYVNLWDFLFENAYSCSLVVLFEALAKFILIPYDFLCAEASIGPDVQGTYESTKFLTKTRMLHDNTKTKAEWVLGEINHQRRNDEKASKYWGRFIKSPYADTKGRTAIICYFLKGPPFKQGARRILQEAEALILSSSPLLARNYTF